MRSSHYIITWYTDIIDWVCEFFSSKVEMLKMRRIVFHHSGCHGRNIFPHTHGSLHFYSSKLSYDFFSIFRAWPWFVGVCNSSIYRSDRVWQHSFDYSNFHLLNSSEFGLMPKINAIYNRSKCVCASMLEVWEHKTIQTIEHSNIQTFK